MKKQSNPSVFLRIKNQRYKEPKVAIDLDVITLADGKPAPSQTVVLEFRKQQMEVFTREGGIAPDIQVVFDCTHQGIKDQLYAWIKGIEDEKSAYDLITGSLENDYRKSGESISSQKKAIDDLSGIKVEQSGQIKNLKASVKELEEILRRAQEERVKAERVAQVAKEEREKAVREREAAVTDRETAAREREAARRERDKLTAKANAERDQARKERDEKVAKAKAEKDQARKEKEATKAEAEKKKKEAEWELEHARELTRNARMSQEEAKRIRSETEQQVQTMEEEIRRMKDKVRKLLTLSPQQEKEAERAQEQKVQTTGGRGMQIRAIVKQLNAESQRRRQGGQREANEGSRNADRKREEIADVKRKFESGTNPKTIKNGETVVLHRELYRFEGDIVIEKGGTLAILPGAYLEFGRDAGIVCHGALLAEGLEDKMIMFTSSHDKTDDPRKRWRNIHISGADARCSLKHCTIEKGIGRKEAFSQRHAGGGISVVEQGQAKLSNVTIRECLSQYGGGIYALSSLLNIENSMIHGNNSRIAGGGIMAASSNVLGRNNRIERNRSANLGGGMCLCFESEVKMENTVIGQNEAAWGSVEGSGGGIFLAGKSHINLQTSQIVNNRATQSGAGICATDDSFVHMRNGAIRDNRIKDMYADRYGIGAAVFSRDNSRLSIEQSEITGNFPDGITIMQCGKMGANTILADCEFSNNGSKEVTYAHGNFLARAAALTYMLQVKDRFWHNFYVCELKADQVEAQGRKDNRFNNNTPRDIATVKVTTAFLEGELRKSINSDAFGLPCTAKHNTDEIYFADWKSPYCKV